MLGEVPLFSSCSLSELRAIARLGTQIGAEKGAMLTRQGKPGREFFLILEGTATCKVGRRLVARFATGDYFGEMALLSGGYRSATVEAVTPMELLVLDAREFRSLLIANPPVSVKMLAHLAERVASADAQYTD
ncbi:MAG TPA: cyclic nucleotide-binding domain-containing protein [Acidimicrobiales bacterium]|nr:cyclic nucleotide-binding domain-containing protein [Acidimicrobiales bacterium]